MLEYQNRVFGISHAKDGDTYFMGLAIAPRIGEWVTGRLMGWDCPETRRPATDFELAAAAEALGVAQLFLAAPGALWCRRELKTDSFGRELVTLWHDVDGIVTDLGQTLGDLGLATRWPTRWRTVYDAGGRV